MPKLWSVGDFGGGPSTSSKALDRFGDPVFDRLFQRSIVQCQASGLIEGRVFHVDATTIRADLDENRVGAPDSPDPDARFERFPNGKKRPGYKQSPTRQETPPERLRLSRLQKPCGGQVGDGAQTVVDRRARVVVGLMVTAADPGSSPGPEGHEAVAVVDQAVEQLGAGLTAVCADRAYASGANRAAFEDRGIR